MLAFQPGLVHLPVTPFTPAGRIDFDRFGQLIDFHIRHRADALALPTHVGESLSLTDDEKRALIAFSVKHIAGRAPLIAHVSDAGTAIAAALARHAQDAGAAAILATTPYYWTPPPEMILEHFAQIGAAVRLPFWVHNSPEDMSGSKVSAELMLKLIGRLGNFAGLVDSSLDWQFMIDLIMEARHARPGRRHRGKRHVGSARRDCAQPPAPHVRSLPAGQAVRGPRRAGRHRAPAPVPQGRRRREP
jgi:4-hydroxy-tetrahydrodipicolinate synthase